MVLSCILQSMKPGRDNRQRVTLGQCFSNHGSRPKSGSPRLCGWVAKAYKLPQVKEKNLCAQDLRSEEPSEISLRI